MVDAVEQHGASSSRRNRFWTAAVETKRLESFVSKCETGERKVDVVELEEFARLYEKGIE